MTGSRSLPLLRQLELEAQRAVPRSAKAETATPGPEPRQQIGAGSAEIVDSTFFWLFVAGLAWVPYLWGSNVLEAWGINAVLFPGLAVAYEISLLVRGASHPVAVKTIRISAALFVAVVVWMLIQNATWTPTFLHHPAWGMAANELQTSVEGSISVNRDLTALALVRLITAASVFWLAIQLCRNGARAFQFLIAFVAISAGYAVYGLIAFAQEQAANTSSPSFVTSTFYNRNHYATYAGIGLIAVLGLVTRMYERSTTREGSLRFRIAALIDLTGQRALFLLAAAFLLVVTLILTQSRGGIIATGLGVMVWATLTLGRSKNALVGRRIFVLLLCIAIGGVVVTFGDAFLSKIAQSGLVDSNRIAVDVITLRSILDEPLFGYGYGTFADMFPMFRDRSIDIGGVWEQAHNTYLEVFQGLGVLFGSMLVASVLLLIVKCFRGAFARQQITIPCVAAGVASLVAVHALVDFSLQIQAVTLTFMAILGAGVAQSDSSQLALAD